MRVRKDWCGASGQIPRDLGGKVVSYHTRNIF
jgi:hypothetical protein